LQIYISFQTEYPKYTPLLAKILEGLVSRSYIKDKFLYHEEVHIVRVKCFTIISPLPPLWFSFTRLY